jgi:hypothetical protein
VRDGGSAAIAVTAEDGVATFEIRGAGPALPDETFIRMRDRVDAIGGRPAMETSAAGWTAAGRLPLSR